MFRIAVVDDNLEYAQFVKKKIHEILYREKVVCDVEVFDKPMAFLCEVLEEDAFDVCFLDIEMPSMNGLNWGDSSENLATESLSSILQYMKNSSEQDMK